MREYPKINTVFKRTSDGRKLIEGEYSQPEFEYLKNNEWVFTEKVDGTNIRVMWDGEKITFGGKTDRAQIPATLFAWLQGFFLNRDDDYFATTFQGCCACLYGEGYGAGIQKAGKLYLPDGPEFVLFDVKVEEWWLERVNVEDVAAKLGLRTVPIIGRGTLPVMIDLVKTGLQSVWGEFRAEGIVARPAIELTQRNGSRIITKLKHRDFK